jgi:uncharacterized protein involved in type VI secretion and phage assembly
MNNLDMLHQILGHHSRDEKWYGVVVGIVTNNKDPDNMHRVKVRFPWLNQDDDSNWARVANPMAGNGRKWTMRYWLRSSMAASSIRM